MSGITPGPWTAELEEDSPHWTLRAPYPGKGNATFELCRMSGTTAQNEIDARAISLVPEMIAMLKDARGWYVIESLLFEVDERQAIKEGQEVPMPNPWNKRVEAIDTLMRKIEGDA